LFFFKPQSDPYAIIDHEAEVFEQCKNLLSRFEDLFDSFYEPHIIPD